MPLNITHRTTTQRDCSYDDRIVRFSLETPGGSQVDLGYIVPGDYDTPADIERQAADYKALVSDALEELLPPHPPLGNDVASVNWEVHERLHDLIQRLMAIEQRSYYDSMSDDFYHTNGGYANAKAQAKAVEDRIRDLCPNIDLTRTIYLNYPHWHPHWELWGTGAEIRMELA